MLISAIFFYLIHIEKSPHLLIKGMRLFSVSAGQGTYHLLSEVDYYSTLYLRLP